MVCVSLSIQVHVLVQLRDLSEFYFKGNTVVGEPVVFVSPSLSTPPSKNKNNHLLLI